MISTKPSPRARIYLSDYTTGRDNNFTLLRFVAATAVLVSHSFVLTGQVENEPLTARFGLSLGAVAVHVFFVASGFLVTGSLLYRQSLRDFVAARALRIYPGLWVAVLVTIVAVGFAFTARQIGQYMTDRETWRYLARNAVLIRHPIATLPGAFSDVPYKDAVNGSLWTLPWEIRMYVALAAFWVLAKMLKVNAVRFLSAVCIALASVGTIYVLVLFLQKKDDVIALMSTMFAVGAALRVLQNRIPVSNRLAMVLCAVLMLAAIFSPFIFGLIYRLAVPYLVVYFAFVPGGFIRHFNALGDYSYGIYIYAFPIQQATAHFLPGIQPYEMMAKSFALTLLFAVGSWHLVESRALGLKDRFMKKQTSSSVAG